MWRGYNGINWLSETNSQRVTMSLGKNIHTAEINLHMKWMFMGVVQMTLCKVWSSTRFCLGYFSDVCNMCSFQRTSFFIVGGTSSTGSEDGIQNMLKRHMNTMIWEKTPYRRQLSYKEMPYWRQLSYKETPYRRQLSHKETVHFQPRQ